MTAQPAPRRRASRPKDRADRILDAATRLFCERGYFDVTLDDIGEAVGITASAIYRHFASKDALLLAVNERLIEKVQASYAGIDRDAYAPQERVRALVQATVGPAIEGLNYWLPATSELRHLPRQTVRELQAHRAAVLDVWVEALNDAHPARDRADAEFIAEVGGGVGPSLQYYQPQLSRARLTEILRRFVSAAFLSPDDDGTDELPTLSRARRNVGRKGQQARAAARWAVRPRRSSPRERILASAVPLFRRHGFSGVGIDKVGEDAGTTGPGVYRHFKNKEDILFAAMSRVVEQLTVDMGRALASSDGPLDALERLVDGYLMLTTVDTDLMAVYWTQRFALSPDQAIAVARGERSYVDDWISVVQCVRSDVSDAEARVMSYAALGIMNGYWQARTVPVAGHARAVMRAMVIHAVLTA